MNTKNKAFTLVELIVVITILAILATIAFLSFQNISSTARDSSRLSDISNIKKTLELTNATNGNLPLPDGVTQITRSGSVAWYQGTMGDTAIQTLKKFSKKPIDSLAQVPYTYSVTSNQKEYQIGYALENSLAMNSNSVLATTPPARILASPSLRGIEGELQDQREINTANADTSSFLGYTDGNYNGVMIKVSTGSTDYYLGVPSIITSDITKTNLVNQTGSLVFNGKKCLASSYTGIVVNTNCSIFNPSNFLIYSGTIITDTDKTNFLTNLKNVYTGSVLNTTNNTDLTSRINGISTTNNLVAVLGKVGTSVSSLLILNNINNFPTENIITEIICTGSAWYWVNDIIDTIGNGFCISPRVTGGTEYISWMDIGTSYGWVRTNASPMTGANAYADNGFGVTYDLGNYTCKSLGTAVGGLTLSDSNNALVNLSDNPDSTTTTDDTLANRMRYLAKYKTDSIKLDSIDWVIVPNKPATYTIPALFLSDCIDGIRDLADNEGKTLDGITYAQYSDFTTNTNASRILRNRYLLGWTNQTGSHLPSAYSDILSETTNNLTTNKGEYQIACEANKLTDSDNGISRIFMASLGIISGTNWGNSVHTLGIIDCSTQASRYAGYYSSNISARFIVR